MAQATGILERQFKLSQFGTSVRTEFMAGVTTFLVMAYIIAVNPATLTFNGALTTTQVATVTCLVAGVMSIVMGLYANRAVAIAPGLGLNAVVAYTFVGSMGLSFPEAMGIVVTEGLLITVLVLTGVPVTSWRQSRWCSSEPSASESASSSSSSASRMPDSSPS
ncbi:MAG: solute carrier family 23 protein [Thermomicrobiales bacterium]